MADGSGNWIRRGGAVLGVAVVVATPFMLHLAIATGRFTRVAIAFAMVQALVVAVVAIGRKIVWQRNLGIAVAVGLLVVRLVGSQAVGRVGLIADSGLSHALIYGSLLALFARSLRAGRTPIVTGLAARLRGRLTPAMHAYTRTVTKAWCVFFAAQLAVSAILLAFAPDRVWSLFVNVLDGPAVIALFLAEYAIRRWRFRHDSHSSPLVVARSFARSRADG